MKKLFFPKSSSSHGGERHEKSAASTDTNQPVQMQRKKASLEPAPKNLQNPKDFFPGCERKVTERKTVSRSLVFRRSRSLSMSSATNDSGSVSEKIVSELKNRRKFPSSRSVSESSDGHLQFRDRDSKPEKHDVSTFPVPSLEFLRDRACSTPSNSNSSSPPSSFGSTSISGQVIDLYMDGDHRQEKKSDHRPGNRTRLHNQQSNVFQPSHSASRDSMRSEHHRESPRKLAKNVVERLLRLEQFSDSNSGDVCANWPPVPSTICDKHLDGKSYTPANDFSGKGSTLKDILDEDTFGIDNRNSVLDREYGTFSPEQKGDPTDSALRRKLEEVKERAIQLSREVTQKSSFQFYTGNISALCQMVRNLIEEERNLVLEISDHLQCRISERAAAKETTSQLREEMNSVIVKLEREKDELQSRLQRELHRRSDEWESKLRVFQSEEHRLRDRLRELAEQNVSLQKELSAIYNNEKVYNDRLSRSDAHLKDLINNMDIARFENDNLHQKLSEMQYKLKDAEEYKSRMERNYKDKDKENIELMKSIARLRGSCSEQERTIDGLRQCLNSEMRKQQTSGELEKVTDKLRIEQLRLTEVEQLLRRQLETCTVEVESLRGENIYLLERLKGTGKMSGPSSLKLDQELEACVNCLQSTGLSLLNESIQTCEMLIENFRRKEVPEGSLEVHTLIQHDTKVQGFKKGLEQLTRSLGKATGVLKERAEPGNYEPGLPDPANGRLQKVNRIVSEDDLKSELKAESLLTSILKEKVYSKEKEIERLQAELARAVRNYDVLKSETQEAFDTVSCVNHKMKNLELQMIRKDGTVNQLQDEVRSQDEELSTTRATLSKITQERDLMWEEVKQYSEKNMLLNREVHSLKKKIDALEEETLLKDGQISILKDSLNNARHFDSLFGTEQGEMFNL